MSVVFDLDTVSVDFIGPFARMLELKYNLPTIEKEKLDKWYWNNTIGITREQFDGTFDEFCEAGCFERLKPLDGIYLALAHFSRKYGQVYFVTNRPESVQEDTRKSVKRLFGDYYTGDNLIFSSRKGLDCAALNATVALEDAPHHAVDIVVHSETKVYLKDMPYNRFIMETPQLKRFQTLINAVEIDSETRICH